MKLKPLIIVLFVCIHVASCAYKPLKLGVISDVHYLSEKWPMQQHADTKETTAILDAVLSDYLQSDIDVLLIAGDMTMNGEKQSHLDFVAKLRPLIDKGVRVFVVPGNHDINISATVENVSADDFTKIYKDCGYASAIRRDTASLSYVAALNDKTWLLALDACRYRERTATSFSGGRLSASTESWVIKALSEAKEQNVTVISMLHHGLVEHFPYQANLFPQYLIDDWQRLAGLFADNGVKSVFTGHFHANDISEYTSENNNKIYDIETGSLSAYPYPYRFVELSDKGLTVSTQNLQSIPSNPNLLEDGKAKLKAWAKDFAGQKIRERNLSPDSNTASRMLDIASDIILLHVAGEEVVSDTLRQKITKLAEDLDVPMFLTPENMQIDTPPADNNVKLEF